MINRCFGGFSISAAAIQRYGELAGLDLFSKENGVWELNWFCKTDKGDEYFSSRNIPRDDPNLIRVVEEMGEASFGSAAELAVVDIPDDIEFTIEDYDGQEWVAEVHRTWY